MTSSSPTFGLVFDDPYYYDVYDDNLPMAIFLPPTDSPTVPWYTANEYETDVSEPESLFYHGTNTVLILLKG